MSELDGEPEPPAPLDGVPADMPRRRPDLVLLPGMLGDVTAWDDVAALLLADASVRTARIDLDDTVADIAAGVLADAPPHFALAGHSLGGIVALEVVRQAPSRVTRLALLNTSARPPSDAQLAVWAQWRERTARGGFPAVARELALVNLPPRRQHDTRLVERVERMGLAVGEQGFLRQLQAQAGRPDSMPSLSSVTAPTLVVGSQLDEVSPPALQRELAVGIPGAALQLLPGCGHLSVLEDPAAVAALLIPWLRAG